MPWKFTSNDWNPITYAEAASPHASAREAYRGSKTLAEREAWKFMGEQRPGFDLVTLCPSMVFGPLAQKSKSSADLNESNKMLWKVASGTASQELPPCQFNFWIDVRDLAQIHVQALLTPTAGGRGTSQCQGSHLHTKWRRILCSARFHFSRGIFRQGCRLSRNMLKSIWRRWRKISPASSIRHLRQQYLIL